MLKRAELTSPAVQTSIPAASRVNIQEHAIAGPSCLQNIKICEGVKALIPFKREEKIYREGVVRGLVNMPSRLHAQKNEQ